MDKTEFLNRVADIFEGRDLDDVPTDELVELMGVCDYATNLLLNEAERRDLIGGHMGSACIPTFLPKGVDLILTILTR